MAGGDYSQWQFHYQRVVADLDTLAAPAISARSVNHQIFIQKIMNVGSAPVIVADIDPLGVAPALALATVPVGALIDFGPIGTPVRVGFRVDTNGPTGGRLHIEGYQKIATAMALGSNN